MSDEKSIREAYRTPNPRSFIVTNADGKPMGKMSLSAPFGPVPLQFSYCFNLEEAARVAEQIGGTVKHSPVFDNLTKEWVIPSLEIHTAQ